MREWDEITRDILRKRDEKIARKNYKEQQGEGMQMQGLAENFSSLGPGNLVSGATAPQIP